MQTLTPSLHLKLPPIPKSTHLLPHRASFFQPPRLRPVRCCSRPLFPDKGEDDFDALIKNKFSSMKIPETLGYVSPNLNFNGLPTLGKEHLFGLMIAPFIHFLKNHVEFIIRPAAYGGADMGLRWHLEWKNKNLHLGPVCTLETSHVYTGKIYLRNGKDFLDRLSKWKLNYLEILEGPGKRFLDVFNDKAAKYFVGGLRMHIGVFYFLIIGFLCFIVRKVGLL
ncbi:hypothetical protein HPP92_015464 [Vanilla planifolia]|uniref:Uncharacterized protein n=1 Tax=Vanilla planifolia TaxID=51239 RepID=A0A835QTM3_VANPL|nr:hypothetical protein HPP92_015464 [Vanilla planifolia]